MDYSNLSQLVGSLGFPIVCCCYMMISNNKVLKELTGSVNALKETISVLISMSGSEKNE